MANGLSSAETLVFEDEEDDADDDDKDDGSLGALADSAVSLFLLWVLVLVLVLVLVSVAVRSVKLPCGDISLFLSSANLNCNVSDISVSASSDIM